MQDFRTWCDNVLKIRPFQRLRDPVADNPSARVLHSLLIGSLGWTVVCGTSERGRDSCFRVVVLAQIAAVCGMEWGREVKIAALTAPVFPEDRAYILAAGVDDFGCKPFQPADISDCMSRHPGVRFISESTDTRGITGEERCRPEDFRVLRYPIACSMDGCLVLAGQGADDRGHQASIPSRSKPRAAAHIPRRQFAVCVILKNLHAGDTVTAKEDV